MKNTAFVLEVVRIAVNAICLLFSASLSPPSSVAMSDRSANCKATLAPRKHADRSSIAWSKEGRTTFQAPFGTVNKRPSPILCIESGVLIGESDGEISSKANGRPAVRHRFNAGRKRLREVGGSRVAFAAMRSLRSGKGGGL